VSSRQASLIRYLRDSRIELKKVTWPTREQTVNLTIVVCVVCVVIALFLGGVDFLFASLVSALNH
jgi:preprotein translocase subunit SecE